MNNLQKQSHKTLLIVLNNIGIIGAIMAGIADIIFVIIFVVGVKIDIKINSIILFAVVNSLIGLLINILLRYQGIKYAEIENQETVSKYYNKIVEENKKPLELGTWQLIQGLKDFLIKGLLTVFSIFGVIYISIEGSKNPIQILITLASLILFTCFGLISMNNSYDRFYNIQLPYMEIEIKKRSEKKCQQ